MIIVDCTFTILFIPCVSDSTPAPIEDEDGIQQTQEETEGQVAADTEVQNSDEDLQAKPKSILEEKLKLQMQRFHTLRLEQVKL